jgi:hypothetical protein
MSQNVTPLPDRGFTYHGGTPGAVGKSIVMEGSQVVFRDDVAVTGESAKSIRSNRMTHAVLVRNTSGGVLLPGRQVTWAAGFRGRRVNGYSTTTAVEVAGVVDDQLPVGGVANNDLFWLLRKGPALVKTPLAGGAGNVFAEGNALIALTAATSGAITAGRPAVFDFTATSTGTTNGDLGRALANRFGRVMSAMTTGQTDAFMLVDLDIR